MTEPHQPHHTPSSKIPVDKAVDRAKEITDVALEKVGELAGKAGGKAQALTDLARERAPEVVDKVTELAEKAIDAVDKATGGRLHSYLDADGKSGTTPPSPHPRHSTATPPHTPPPHRPEPPTPPTAG